MKIKYGIAAVAASALLAGCNPDNDTKPVTAPVATNPTNTLTQTKDEFLASMDAKMKDMDTKIDQLRAKAANYKDDAKAQSDKALDELHTQREALGKKYDEVKASSQDAWDRTKAACAVAWDDMQKAYDDAKSKFTQ